MAFLHCLLLLLVSPLSVLASATQSQTRPAPAKHISSLVVPVKKDAATGLHVATLQKRTPLVSVPLLVDLNAPITTVNCQAGGRPYLSSRYDAPLCYSTQCSRAAGPHHPCLACRGSYPGCHNNTCGIAVANPITHSTALGELAQDSLSLLVASSVGGARTVPQFLFVCAPKELLSQGLPQKASGAVGFGHSHNSLPNQASSQLGFPPKFSMCLPRGYGNGAVFLGDAPSRFPGGVDVASKLTHAPLSVSAEGEYRILLNGIRINNKVVRTSLTRATISTAVPYSIMEHTLFAAVTRFFANQMGSVPRVSPVAPFGVCFEAGRVAGTRVGPAVPMIDLVVQGGTGGQSSTWRIMGANSMVEARPGVTCLAFVDGGRSPGSGAMVIGAYQLEDNLVQFDLAKSVLGFSSSLLFQRTSCSNFKYAT